MSSNSNIKGLCEFFLREKKGADKEGDGTVTFEVVEVKQQAKKRITGQKKYAGQKNVFKQNQGQNWMEKNKGNRQTGKRKKMIDGQRQMQNALYKKEMKAKSKAYKDLSYQVNPHWPLLEEIRSLTLSNIPKFTPGTPSIFLRAGKVAEYRHEVDSVLSKTPIKFTSFPEIQPEKFSSQDINLDPHIIEHIEEKQIKGLKIIASDMVLATLMNVSKSCYSWDIKVEKFEDMIFLTKREKEEKEEFVSVDYENVGENSITPPPASVEDPKSGMYLFFTYSLLSSNSNVLFSCCSQHCSTAHERGHKGKKIIDLICVNPMFRFSTPYNQSVSTPKTCTPSTTLTQLKRMRLSKTSPCTDTLTCNGHSEKTEL